MSHEKHRNFKRVVSVSQELRQRRERERERVDQWQQEYKRIRCSQASTHQASQSSDASEVDRAEQLSADTITLQLGDGGGGHDESIA